jgi:hypothetical protein
MIKISENDLHPHIVKRMNERGITKAEIETVLNKGKPAQEAKPGTYGKFYVFTFQGYWESQFYEEKEVTVFYKQKKDKIILLTVIARYGKDFEHP